MTVLKKGFDFSGNKWVSNAEFIRLYQSIEFPGRVLLTAEESCTMTP